MAAAYICDRCGKTYPVGCGILIPRINIGYGYINPIKSFEGEELYDVCKDCYKDFAKWINQYSDVEEEESK